jgi:long-chain acyl-CoA synthetase
MKGGYRISPQEIEEILIGHPDIQECVVFGVPDDQLGERISAVLSVKPGAQVNETDLLIHCKSALAPYKVPRQIAIVPEIPKSSSGKIQRETLLELLSFPSAKTRTIHVSES